MSGVVEAAPPLLSIRREIEEIDRALVLLVAARIDAACSAIRIRSEQDGRLSDPAQEELVLARAQDWAERAGLPPSLVETIFRAVLAAGKARFANSQPSTGGATPLRARSRPRRSARGRPGSAIRTSPDEPVPT